MASLFESYGIADEPVDPTKAPVADQPGQMRSGFNRAFAEVPAIAAGSAAYLADLAGANETRDKLLSYAKESSDATAKVHENDAGSITDAWDGKVPWSDFLKNATGYVAGQALQGIATGGLGALSAKMLATQGIKAVAEKVAAAEIAKGATKEVAIAASADASKAYALKMATRGAVVGAGGQNLNMELGSIYPTAVEEAGGANNLTGGDKLRVGASALAAAGVDTAAEAITAGRVFRGSNVGAGEAVAPKLLGSEVLGRAVREIPSGMAREAGTEGVQTAIEHYGAGQPIADEKGVRDIVDSMGVGAVGGILGGAGASLHSSKPAAEKVPEVGPLSRAANLAPPLQIGNTPDPMIGFADGTVGRKSEVDAYIASLPIEQQPAARAKLMGLAPQVINPSFADILDTENVYKGWSNTQDGQDRAIMREQMDYIEKTYGPLIAIDNQEQIKKDLAKQFKWFKAATDEQQNAALTALQTNRQPVTQALPPAAPVAPAQPAPIGQISAPTPDNGSDSTPIGQVQEGDILNGYNLPFKSLMAANHALKPHADTHEVVAVEGGHVIRPKQKATDGTANPPSDMGTKPTQGPSVDAPTGDHAPVVVHPDSGRGGAGTLAEPVPTGEPAAPVLGTNTESGTVAEGERNLTKQQNVTGKYATPAQPTTLGKAAKPIQPEGTRGFVAGDVLNKNGEPFKTKVAAEAEQKRSGAGEVVPVTGGWVVRQPTSMAGTSVKPVQPTGTRGTNAGDVVKAIPKAAEKAPEPAPETTKNAVEMTQAEYISHMEKNRNVPLKGGVENGSALWKSMHKDIVEQALQKGEAVSPEVLADYPELQPTTTAGPTSPTAPEPTADDTEVPETETIVEHTTAKGKVLRGVVRHDMTLAQAKLYDPYAFNKNGGVFIREAHIDKLPKLAPSGSDSTPTTGKGGGTIAEPAPGATTDKPKAEPKAPTEPGTPTGDTAEPVAPKEPKAPEDFSAHPFAETWNAMDVAVRKELLTTLKYDGDQRTIFANNAWDGLSTQVQKKLIGTIPKEPKPEKVEKPVDAMADMVDGSDFQGIAEKAYEGIRAVEPEDFPVILPDDRLIRLPVLVAEHTAVEANLKKLKFRITDRSQESGTAGRMLISAIYKPDSVTVGDAGEQMAGGRKNQDKPELPPKDASDTALDKFLSVLHPSNYLNPQANPEQSFGAMMFKEALMDGLKSPLDFIGTVIKDSYSSYYYTKSLKEVLKKALANDLQRVKVQTLADQYVARLTLLQDTLTPHNRVADAFTAFTGVYVNQETGRATQNGTDLNNLAKSGSYPLRNAMSFKTKFEANEDTTDQTHRAVKKDADLPPRLERIIRIGMKDHRQGKNVVDEDFTTTFGFRGLEFGNWVNQIERQENLNLAYDSLMDLSDLTGIAPKNLGMLGKLGFAIGARGQNPRAAAHFEPANNVINLTKTKGNGTVGHEWFHGLDDNISRMQDTSGDGNAYSGSQARTAVNALAVALQRKMDADKGEQYLRALLRSSATDSNRNTPPKQAVFEAIAGNQKYRYSTPNAYGSDALESLKFYQAARAMDAGGDAYWAKGVELLARAFETYAYDKSKGGTPYLVGPSRADGAMTEANGYKGTPYPRGAEREYIAGLIQEFLDLFDGDTMQMKSYKPEYKVQEIKGMGWIALDQHGVDVANSDGRMTVYKKEAEAAEQVKNSLDSPRFLNAERTAHGKLNQRYRDFATNIDKIMEEMGIERWPEIKNGSLAESMFFHLRQGWWPENNQALKVYAAKAHNIQPSEIDLLKLKGAQEDFEAALGRYAGQRVVDMHAQGADSQAVYQYLVDLYKKQPNLDVRTGTSQANMAFSTPIPIGYAAGIMGHVTSKDTVFDTTGGNGMLVLSANPKNVVTIELEPHRAQNLRLMEIGKVIEGNALDKIDSDIRKQEADVLLFNPPFGAMAQSVGVPSWDGRSFQMSKLDHLIAAKGMKAMADKGRAVIVLGAHKIAGSITSTDRVFLNWLYSNYNVVDHFEVDGDMYARQGANWPLRILVVAGRKETVTAFPVGFVPDRVMDFDQLWSRSDEARKRAETVLVGAGVKSDEAGGENPDGSGVPSGDKGKTAGADGKGTGPNGDSELANGGSGRGTGPDGKSGTTDGTTVGDNQRGGNGKGGSAVDGAAGKPDSGSGRGRGAGRTDPRGLSDLSDDDIDALINGALEEKPKRAPKSAGTSSKPGTPTGDIGPIPPGMGIFIGGAPKAKEKAKPGKSILDDIPGLGDLLNQLDGVLNGTEPDLPPTPPTPPTKPGKKRETALERRERLKAESSGTSSTPTAIQPIQPIQPAATLLLGYTPVRAQSNTLDILSGYQHSQKTLARSIQSALDYQLEQDNNPTAPVERVSSRAMFSRQVQEDAQYGKVEPLLSAIWTHLSQSISDISQRITTFTIGAVQKWGKAIAPFINRFIKNVRGEQNKIPDGKKPIRAEAIDNEAQVVYRGRSAGDSSGIFVPRNQAVALERAFDAFEATHGEVDQFVQKALGYKSVDDMHKGPDRGPSQGLAGYQVDALALGISSMQRGDGFIIGDDTGVGKGRSAAALMAWAVNNGKVPIFFSYKADLYSAMHDDLTDIGMSGRVSPMPTDADAIIRDRNGKTILKNDAKSAKKDLEHIIKTGTMPAGKNAMFTTYFQNNTANLRRQAIQRLVADGKAVIIMDEAHNAAGESSTNQFFMGLLTGQGLFGGNEKDGFDAAPDDWVAPQTAYLSATFAKRPSNMPVYIRTQLRHAANTPGELVELFNTGGDVMQQIASEMLVSSGSMIRRERSYAGVKFDYVTDEANAPRDSREVDAATEVLRQIVYADRAFGAWVKTPEGQAAVNTLVPPGAAAIASGSGADTAINKSEFTSVVHNYVGQLLLATKVDKAVELAINALNAGQKPVLTLQNTMEAALNDFVSMEKIAEGDPLEGFGWQSILKRGLTSARRVVFDAGTGNRLDNIRISVPTEMMPPSIAAEFARTQALIDKFQSDLPGSPIDALRHKLSQYYIVETQGADGQTVYSATKTPAAGSKSRKLVAVEVTGREFGVDYSTAIPTYMRRQDPDNLEIIRGFQGGSRSNGKIAPPIDIIILNSSGSTGISLHASEMAIDQRPRHMIVLQPNPDIAVFKQTTGRIHRTGQVEWPFFTVLATGIPAERRALAMLKKKIGALFSNTSSGEGTTNVDAVDFINGYGDIITAQYLEDNPDIAMFIGVAQPTTPEGSDIAKKASGRAALLSVSEQRDYYDTIEQQFLMEIEQRNATGTNKLTRRALDFQASPTEIQVLEEGMDEENPFTSSAYITKYDINVVGDIPSPDKVRDAITSSLGGRSSSDVINTLVSSLATRYDEALNQLTLRRAEVAGNAVDEKATDSEKAALVGRLGEMDLKIQGFATRRERTISALTRDLAIGNGANSMTVGDVESKAVILGVSIGQSTSKVGNPYAPSNVIIHFQRNVPGGRLSVPLSKIEAQEYNLSGWTRRPDIDDWFGLRNVSGGRQARWIANGNLLRARAILNGGEIALHTLEGSTPAVPLVQGGIIMPTAYAPGNATKSDFTIRYAGAATDYVLAMLQSAQQERADRYGGDSDYQDKANTYRDAQRFQTVITKDQRNAIAQSGVVIAGPRRGWMLDMSTYSGEMTLYVGKDFPRLIRSKDLKDKLRIELAKKRNETQYSARVPSDAATVKGLVKLLSMNSPIIAPEPATDIVRELSRQHFKADNSEKGAAPDAPPTAFSRGTSSKLLSKEQVTSIVDAIKARWKNAPEIVVVDDINSPEVPKAVQDQNASQMSQGATGTPEGFYLGGKVYIVASAMNKPGDVVRVLFHETLGHAGLRGVFGDALDGILKQIVGLRRKDVAAKAKQYGLDMGKPDEAMQAAEEVLAEMAQTHPNLGFVSRAIAAIRAWLRSNVPGFTDMKLANSEIISQFILPARRFIENGNDPDKGKSLAYRMGVRKIDRNAPSMYSRSIGQTLTAAFKAWFGNSRATGKNGKPLMLYHGTSENFDVFNDSEGPMWFALKPQLAERYAGSSDGANIIPVHIRAENPLNIENMDMDSIFSQKVEDSLLYELGEDEDSDQMQDVFKAALKEHQYGGYPHLFRIVNSKAFSTYLISRGYDSIKVKEDGKMTWAVLSKNQIKSATGNNGAFDSANPDIRFSRSVGEALTSGVNTVRNTRLAAGYQLGDLFQGEGRLHWWHNSVGSMYHLAHKSPAFKKVYDSIQSFLSDVSYYAAEAADLAPNLLPKLDTLKDVLKSAISPEDNKSLSAPVFEGTLTWARDSKGKVRRLQELEAELGATSLDDKAHMMVKDKKLDPAVLRMWQGMEQDQYESIINNKFEKEYLKPGVVFTPAELKQHFNMTDAQIKLYQEFRSTTDKSIDNLALSEMLNYAGKDALPLHDQIMDSKDVSEAGQTLRDYLLSLSEVEPGRDTDLSEKAAKMLDIAARAVDLKDKGYAPLSRFGQYTLEATLSTGERYFSLFETDRARNKMTRMLTDEGATGIKTGTMSQESYKLLNGITPETAALFGEMLGLDSQGNEASDLAFQEYIKRGLSNRSAMKRLLHRKGIAGFSEDSARVLAGFVYSNARKTASNLNTKSTAQAVDEIPKEQGELKDAAVRLQEYVSNPTEEAGTFRSLLFAQYLGGSIASAMVNATQPFAVTLPYLSQFGGITKAAKQMTSAVRDAARDTTGDTRLDAALKKAEESGIVSPQEVHQLMAQSVGKASLQSGDGTRVGNAMATGSNALSKLSMAWGKVFSVAEQFNRRVTFIAAYRTAKEQGMADPAAFAAKAVNETQFVANKGNKARWSRGFVGSILFTFRSYAVNYLELVTRMATAGEPGSAERKAGQKAAVLAIAVLFMLAGSEGLPFMSDIEDLIDGAMQRLGYNFSSKKQLKTFLTMQLGKDGAEFITSGISSLPGVPIDFSGRFGMGNLIPGTGLLQKKTDHTRDLMEFAGPAGDMAKRTLSAADQALKGDIATALTTISPSASRNVVKGIDMAATGMYRDDAGRKVIDTSLGEAAAKVIGFQPSSVKNVQETSAEIQKAKGGYQLAAAEIRAKMAQGIFLNDPDMKQAARDDLASWNAKNPDQNMSINMPAVLSKVKDMRKNKEQRLADTAPKGMRNAIREQIKEAQN